MKSQKRYREAFKKVYQKSEFVHFQSEQSGEWFQLSKRIWKLMGCPEAVWLTLTHYHEELEPE